MILIIGCVAILEVYCGFAYYKYRDNLKSNAKVIRFRKPRVSENRRVNILSKTIMETDSNGFILPFKALDSTEFTIAFLGGSTTECLAVKNVKRPHVVVGDRIPKASCLNIGFSGNNTMHSMNIFVNLIKKYKPKYTVINHNVNDICILLNYDSYYNNDKHRSLVVKDLAQVINYNVNLPKNQFIRKYIPNIALTLLPTYFDGEVEKREFPKTIIKKGLDTEKLKNNYKQSLNGLIKYIKTSGSNPVLLTQGSCFKPYGFMNKERYRHYNIPKLHKELNEIARELARENSLILVDAEKLMFNKKSFFYDCVHYTDSGSIFISNKIADTIIDDLNN